MLGRFLEISVAAPDIAESLVFYESLGFVQAVVGDAWRHPYAVITDGRLVLGLHQDGGDRPSLTWLHPDLEAHVQALREAGIELDFTCLDEESFHRIGFRDPTGLLITLVEARTFSPANVTAGFISRLGFFEEIGLPTDNLDGCAAFWDRLGLVAFDPESAPVRRAAVAARDINLGLYDVKLRRPVLKFSLPEMPDRASELRDEGYRFAKLPGDWPRDQLALLEAPEGTLLLMSETPVEPA
jgi:catechol 2,3-dioxygenase-like lactoylglutathione lyase family enzyme